MSLTAAKTCSYCGRQSEAHVFYCGECGTPLEGEATATAKANIPSDPITVAYDREMMTGAMWCIGGILVTALTYSSAANSPSGGHYVIAYGAIIWGGLRFLRGLLRLSTTAKRKNVGYQDTAYHANLKPEGHTQPAFRPDEKN